jgi:mannose-1-phosphate guanylyltransferase
MNTPSNIKIVILAGGAGTRLWPMSTPEKPKQFQSLISGKSMLQETYDRISFVSDENIYISTSTAYAELASEQLPQIPKENIITEPCRRGTGPGIGLAAALIAKKDPTAVMIAISADHSIQFPEEFKDKLLFAAKTADRDQTLNIIGIKAKFPNVNLGYIQIGKTLEHEDNLELREFVSFKEKPDYETAKTFVHSHSYLWNAGYFIWRVDVILDYFKTLLPQTHEALMAIQNGADLLTEFSKCEDITIDYAVMEKVDPSKVRVIPAELGWSDIGTWESLQKELRSSKESNVTKGQVTLLDTTGSLIYNNSKQPLAVMGMRDVIIVHAEGKILVCPKNKSSQLKDLLKEMNK